MKTICQFIVLTLLVISFPVFGFAQSNSADPGVIEKANNALQEWKSRPKLASAPTGCERCIDLSKRISDVDAQCVPLADGMELLVKDITTVGIERAGTAPLKQLKDATEQLDGHMVQRETLVSQYRSEVEKFKMRKWRPDDSKEREEMRYYNPNRPR